MLNTTTPMQTGANGAYLPDDSDRASQIIGQNINNYVFGDLDEKGDNFTPQNGVTNNPNATNPIVDKKTNPILGLLVLGGIMGAGYAALKKGRGEKVSIPKFETIKKTVLDFINKFKNKAPETLP